MGDFTFTSTAECDACGEYLSSSSDDCDHRGQPVETHVFRRLGEGRDSMAGVECTVRYKWNALEEKLGDEWIQYQWLGTREDVESMLSRGMWKSVGELPHQEMSVDASKDLSE